MSTQPATLTPGSKQVQATGYAGGGASGMRLDSGQIV